MTTLSISQLDFRTPPGFDRTRNAEIGNKDIKFKHLEEAFTSEHWLVRIYKVKNLDNREPLDHKLRSVVPKQKYTSKKVAGHVLFYWFKWETLPSSFRKINLCFVVEGRQETKNLPHSVSHYWWKPTSQNTVTLINTVN